VSAHSISGLVALNLLILGVGSAVLHALRGFTSWNEALMLGGLSYMLGVAIVGAVFVLELVVGLPLSWATITLTAAVLIAAGLVAGHVLGRRFPVRKLSVGPLSLQAAVFAGLAVVYFEALFRSGRLAGLYEFDGWAFWVPKAKAIYFFGGLDRQFFAELPGESYPPLVPALGATSFHFMGSADVVTLHLQFWFFLVGFVAAVAGVLSRRVPPILLWPPILLLLVTPHVVGYALQAEADFLLDELLALAALLVGLWLVEQRAWQLVGAGILLAGAMSTKREGYLLAACIVLSALLASARRARAAWPPLLLTAAVAVVITVPWRVLLVIRDLSTGGPEAGGAGLLTHADRAWPSLRLALSTLFDFDIWLIVAPLALVAIAAAIVTERRLLAVYALALFVLAVAAFTWTTWAFPSLAITKEAALNPISRLTGSLTFAATALVPLLCAVSWSGRLARGAP
jgi:hypothetical protein